MFLRAALLLALSLPLRADEPAIPNRLTETEIAQGWISLFDGKTTFGWVSPNDSKWTVMKGMLAPQEGKTGLLTTSLPFSDYDLMLEFRKAKRGNFSLHLDCDASGQRPGEAMRDTFSESNDGWWEYKARVRGGTPFKSRLDGREGPRRIIPAGAFVDPPGATKDPYHIALQGNGFIVRQLKLRPVEMQPLFNRKSLAGWKEHPNKKSKFSVTKEGWLSLKDGPGDLQTEGQWADFVLQLECKTNGKHLNSGVFFRCLPGEYQQGYEAQIHNGFGDPKDYTLERFDPKSHKKLELAKEKFTALDYGTGAIYRRQPARMQAAKDNEWFTMTVIAHGRHMATWVNGVQTADWTDHRPLEDNARKGAYLKKGPISLQGHDPTTDLLFRNIRIAELPAK